MEKLVANISFGKGVRNATLQGREYLVAPVSMIVEGVLVGSQGPVFYEGPEIQKSVPAWNHKPITNGHPEANGEKVSGCTQEALDAVGLGIILNARWKPQTKKLTAEAWFDKSRLAVVPGGDRIEAALLSSTKLEVSTGLFVDRVPVANGEYKGKQYEAKAVNFAPDHLAILLDEPGACSLADGAGLLVNKAAKTMADCHPIVANAMSLDARVSKVREALYAAYEVKGDDNNPGKYVYVEETYPSYAIFSMSENGTYSTFRQNYELKSGEVTLTGVPVKVTRSVTYTPVTNAENKMDRESLVAALGTKHKDFVANLSDEQAQAIAALQKPEAPAPVKTETQPVVVNSLEDLQKVAGPGLQSQLNDAAFAATKLRDDLVATITANSACPFTADELKAMPLAQLDKVAKLAVVPVAPVAPVTNSNPFFLGSPSPLTTNSGQPQAGFGAPSTL